MTRQLASIQRISEIHPIYVSLDPLEEAANIVRVVVNGWKLIAKRDEFNVGDQCVFFEIDSILPETDWSEFLRPRKFRIKTLKFGKFIVRTQDPFNPTNFFYDACISQGLALPLSILDESVVDVLDGEDVTERLGVTKFELPEQFRQGDQAGEFPSFVPKTDEPRLQSNLRVLENINGLPYIITLKYDGTSVTWWFDTDGTPHVASRNFERKPGDNVYWNAVTQTGLLDKTSPLSSSFGSRYAWQGEVVGPNVQGNLLGLNSIQCYVFNIFDRLENRYVDPIETVNLCATFRIPHVEVLEVGHSFNYTLEQLEQMAKGNYESGKPREGLVIRPQRETFSPVLAGRLSFKVINVDYLLHKGE